MAHAFNIRLPNPDTHAYAQKYCFLNGPDAELNRSLRQAVLDSRVELGAERDADRIRFLSLDEQRRFESELRSVLHVPPELGLSRSANEISVLDLAWKIAAFPDDTQSVLVLGTATCREAIYIRARFPKARIVCTDFVGSSRIPNLERLLDVQFIEGDFNQVLADAAGQFDVVFSNHVLEHLFDPDRTLALARRALRPNGSLISALPLDGQPSTPFSSALSASSLHPLDMCTVDVAHAWKTNVSVLLHKLSAAGFEQIEFSGRDGYYAATPRMFPSRTAFERRKRAGLLLNRVVFGAVRGALKRVFPREVPRTLSRAVFSGEHRVWFGSNRLKNSFSIECLVVAR